MHNNDKAKKLCCKLLKAYAISKNVDTVEIENFKKYKSRMFGFCDVYSFTYKNRDFLVSDDYSLMDDPKFIKAVFEEATELEEGKLIGNPVIQSDGAKYALGLDGTEYYLWESSPV